MTQEDKELLVKDLSARLLYGVICNTSKGNGHLCSINQTIFGVEYGINIKATERDYFNDNEEIIKPYLHPMSSMTPDKRKEYDKLIANCLYDAEAYFFENYNRLYDWLLAHHFDYRGLIDKGLAIEASNDMYKI